MNGLAQFYRRIIAPGSGAGWKTQFFLHLVTGAAATAAHYIVMWFALSAQLWPTLATTIGFSVGATMRFLFSYFHIFEPERYISKALPYFVLVLTLQMALNAALLTLLLIVTKLVWPAQILTTIMLTVFTFLAYKFWVFK